MDFYAPCVYETPIIILLYLIHNEKDNIEEFKGIGYTKTKRRKCLCKASRILIRNRKKSIPF